MKTLVYLPLLLCLARADSSEKQDVKTKMTATSPNTIQSQVPKHELYFQSLKYQQPQVQHIQQLQQVTQQLPHQHQKQQFLPVQFIPRPYYVPQQQPQAMIIIAQPALVPSSLVYGNAMQQLLNYFHTHPQAKYQLLHGQQSPQIPQQHLQQIAPTFMHQVLASPSIGNYILASPPQFQHHNLLTTVAGSSAVQQSPVVHQAVDARHLQPVVQQTVDARHLQPVVQQTVDVRHLQAVEARQLQHAQQAAAAAAQQAAAQQAATQQAAAQQAAAQQAAAQQSASHQASAEHYTTRGQQQPMQLSSIAHLAQLAAQQYVSSPTKSAPAIVTGFENFTPAQQAQIKAQLSNHLGTDFHAVSANTNQYSSKYNQEQPSSDFMPSPQVKETSSPMPPSSSGGDILKAHYNKG